MQELVLILDGDDELCLFLYEDEDFELILTDPAGALIPAYEGDYEVTPRLYEQILETDGKRMTDDVTVKVIPVTYTSNPYNGKTVLIG